MAKFLGVLLVVGLPSALVGALINPLIGLGLLAVGFVKFYS